MRMVTLIYIDGARAAPVGTEMLDLFDPVWRPSDRIGWRKPKRAVGDPVAKCA